MKKTLLTLLAIMMVGATAMASDSEATASETKAKKEKKNVTYRL